MPEWTEPAQSEFTANAIDDQARQATECIEHLFHRFMKHLHRQRGKLAAVAAAELSLQQRKLIQFLAQNGPCTMNDSAEFMMLAVSTMTGIVDKMLAAGLVRRERSEEDRRVVRVSLTEKGERLFHIDIEERTKFMKIILEALPGPDRDAYLSLTRKIVASLNDRSNV